MTVYQLSREFYPYANAGGLKEVVTGIADSLTRNKINSSVFIPCYGYIDTGDFLKKESFFLDVKGSNIIINIYYKLFNGTHLYLLSYPAVSTKNSVYTYTIADERLNPEFLHGKGFLDNDEINIIFQMAFLKYVTNYLLAPDVLNLHDGHTGLIPGMIKSNPSFIKKFKDTKLFFTIHNAGLVYHQRLSAKVLEDYSVIDNKYLCDVCFNGDIDPICLAVLHSKPITVSPYYADEIHMLIHEKSSGGFGEFCNNHNIKITGITNGVNIKHFEKLNISGLPSLEKKLFVRHHIYALLSLKHSLNVWGRSHFPSDKPIFLFQNRITEQKGIDRFIDSIKTVLKQGINSQFVIMGQGETKYEDMLIELANSYPNDICYIQGYDEKIALNLFLASNFFVLTSIWEPCGLTDFEAQLAGSIPIVHNIGGLKKVIHKKTGFKFNDISELNKLIFECESLFYNSPEIIEAMKKNGYENIYNNYTWDEVLLKNYLPLFSN